MTTTNQGDETEGSKVTVGSRWKIRDCNAREFTVFTVTSVASGLANLAWDCGALGAWSVSRIPSDYVFVSAPDAPAPVDWSRWLPPHPLPDTGRKEFKAGQVWAIHDPHDGECMVLLLVSQDDTEILAGRSASGSEAPSFGYSDGRMRHSILVQDVNEPHPRDPATLWGGRCNHGDCRQPLAEGNVELCAEHVASVMGRPAQQEGKSAPVTPQCQPSCRPDLRCNYCTTEVAGPTPTAPIKPKCPACDEERDLGATGKCWDCYEVGEAYVALVQQDADAKRAEIKRTLMQPAALDPMWQRNPNVGVWRLR